MEKLSDVEVVDRALLHGDLVRETTGAERAGLVVASQLLVDVRELAAPHGTHRAVDSCRLRHAQPFRAGTYVVKDGWLGRVEAWRDDVTVEFADGSAAKVYDPKTNRLVPTDAYFMQAPFFPHMRVKDKAEPPAPPDAGPESGEPPPHPSVFGDAARRDTAGAKCFLRECCAARHGTFAAAMGRAGFSFPRIAVRFLDRTSTGSRARTTRRARSARAS